MFDFTGIYRIYIYYAWMRKVKMWLKNQNYQSSWPCGFDRHFSGDLPVVSIPLGRKILKIKTDYGK